MAIFCSFRLFSHRFELVEWVAPAELNGDVACTMTDVGQSRHLGCEPISSGLHLPAQPVDATQALNLSAGVSNCKVSRGRSFS
jgi:hypothetical protein